MLLSHHRLILDRCFAIRTTLHFLLEFLDCWYKNQRYMEFAGCCCENHEVVSYSTSFCAVVLRCQIIVLYSTVYQNLNCLKMVCHLISQYKVIILQYFSSVKISLICCFTCGEYSLKSQHRIITTILVKGYNLYFRKYSKFDSKNKHWAPVSCSTNLPRT